MLIGTIAEQTGVNIETIRYYERIGLLPPPPRSGSRQRLYDREHLRRLTFIRRSRELGFPLDDIRTLLKLVDAGSSDCCATKGGDASSPPGLSARPTVHMPDPRRALSRALTQPWQSPG